MTLKELEKSTGLRYDDCGFITRMAMCITGLKDEEEKDGKEDRKQ